MDLDEVERELTDEFVEVFQKDDSAYESAFGRMILWGHVPQGVNADDPRIMDIYLECLRRGVERLETHAVGVKLRLLAEAASSTYPDMKLTGFSSFFDEAADAVQCEFFFEGPKKFDRALKMEELRTKDGRTAYEKLENFVDTACVDAMKPGC